MWETDRYTTTTHIQVVFDGDAVSQGTIDALDLADALKSYSEAFTRANFLINGRESQASVLVDGNFETGSFDVPLLLVQSFQQAQGIIGELKNALELAFILGLVHNPDSLIALLKFLKGTPPERTSARDTGVEFELGGERRLSQERLAHTLLRPFDSKGSGERNKVLGDPRNL